MAPASVQLHEPILPGAVHRSIDGSKDAAMAKTRFQVHGKLGRGAFAAVYAGVEVATQKCVALKLANPEDADPLAHEGELMRFLSAGSPDCGIPHVFHTAVRLGSNPCLVMELLGKAPIVRRTGMDRGKFAQLAPQVFQRVEYLHSKGLVHRDIKPENFLYGIGSRSHWIYVIDFNLSKAYWGKSTTVAGSPVVHATCRKDCSLVGTPRYVSINVHNGLSQSRRDDLESVGYMLVHLFTGHLPWDSLNQSTPDYHAKLLTEKRRPLADVCTTAPSQLQHFLACARQLKFTEKPDYDELFELMHFDTDGSIYADPDGTSAADHIMQEPVPVRRRVMQPDEEAFAPEASDSTSATLQSKIGSKIGRFFKFAKACTSAPLVRES